MVIDMNEAQVRTVAQVRQVLAETQSVLRSSATMCRLKNYLLILIALWLPIQAVAAMTVSFCHHAPEPVAAQASDCHEPVAHVAHVADSVAAVDLEREIVCGHCAPCHLTSASVLLAPTDNFPLHAASERVPKPITASASHIPEPPQQPPRR